MEKLEGLTKDGKRRSKKTKAGTKTKVCSYCEKRKDRSKFVTGRMCKSCKTKYDKERYLGKKPEIDSRMQKYSRTEKGREVNRKASIKYNTTGKHREVWDSWYRRLKDDPIAYAEYSKKHSANNKVYYALKTGKLTKGICEVCGDPKVHAHHDDYDKPLDVRWLCSLHHGVTRRLY